MINVTSQTKESWKSETAFHTVNIVIGGVTYTNDDVLSESLEISEILESNEYLQFTGCSSSKASFTLLGASGNLKGQSVTITIKSGTTETITLFHGYVDEQETKDYTTGAVSFVCYDPLYTIGQTDVATWYKNLSFPLTLGSFRASLFTYLGLTAVATTLVNDSIQIDRQYIPVNLAAIDVIKAICQINAVYGIINRSGQFEFRTLPTITSTTYEAIDYYKSIDYQRFNVQSIEKVIVRQNENEVGAAYGSDGNTYVVQGNMFTYNLDDVVLLAIAQNIYSNVHGKVYVPYSATTYGMPWVEVGDIITYPVYDPSTGTSTNMDFYVLSRSLKGVQALFDSTEAEGQEYQTVFISNLTTQIDTIKADMREMQRAIDNAVIKHYQAHNASQVSVSSNFVKILDFTPFEHFATDTTDFVFEGSVIMTAVSTETEANNEYTITPAKAQIKYVLNGSDVSYQPIEVYEDGIYTQALNYQFAGLVKNTRTNLEVYIKAVSGSFSIDANNAIGYLWAQNLDKIEIVRIYVNQLPTKVNYMQGQSLDLTDVEIYAETNNGETIDITNDCTFAPADGSTLSTVGSQDIIVTYGDFQTSFAVTVIALDFLRYVIYAEGQSAYVITGLNIANIEADDLHDLPIPNTYNGKEVILSTLMV